MEIQSPKCTGDPLFVNSKLAAAEAKSYQS